MSPTRSAMVGFHGFGCPSSRSVNENPVSDNARCGRADALAQFKESHIEQRQLSTQSCH